MNPETSSAPRGFEGIDLAAAAAVAGGLGLAAWVATQGPTTPIPMHMGLDGTVDRWGGRVEAGLVLALVAALMGATHGLLAWIARTKPLSDAARRGLWYGQLIGLVACLLVLGMIGSMALGAVHPGDNPSSFVRGSVVFLAVIMLVVGGLLGKTTPNPWVGVRTYWSLTSRLAWDKSNRLLGRLWFWMGLLGIPAAFVLPPRAIGIGIVAAMIGTAVLAVVESWRVWMSDPERRVA